MMSSKASELPQIVITKPSASLPNPPVTAVSVQESALTTKNESAEDPQPSTAVEICPPPELDAASIAPSELVPSLAEAETQIEEEFSPAESCNDCVVPVQESRSGSEPADTTSGSSEADEDEFRTRRCCNFNFDCRGAYSYASDALGSRYAIPVWLILMAIPLSAGIMGSIYMFSCPACASLPNAVFMIGVSATVLLTLRICIILHKSASEDENLRLMLQTLQLICMFITVLFYLTESVSYWKMDSSPELGTPKYCHSTFVTYAFWWNIATSVLMVVLALFPVV